MRKFCILVCLVLTTAPFLSFKTVTADTNCGCGCIPMEREELIQVSELIFTGLVAEKKSRWNDRGNMIVTDYVFNVTGVLFGQDRETVTLTFAGGTVGDETHRLSVVPEFNVRDHVLLMVSNMTVPAFSPISGGVQGKFVVSDDGSMVNGHGDAVLVDGRPINLRDFTVMVRNEIPAARSKPLPNRDVKPENLVHVLQDLPALEYQPLKDGFRQNGIRVGNNGIGNNHLGNNLLQPESVRNEDEPLDTPDELILSDDRGTDDLFSGQSSRFAYFGTWASTPIVFNPLPGVVWDQHNMARWNRYGDVFRITTSTGDWSFGNNRNDVAGFVDAATYLSEFGQAWGTGTLAVCWSRFNNSGRVIEADIAFNPAFSWSLDEFSTYDDPNIWPLETVAAHEFGHAIGLEHQFSFMSVMNYPPKKYEAYNKLYTDDTEAIRVGYPSDAVSQSDIGVALYYFDGGGQRNNYSDANLNKTTVEAGSTITISQFVLDNTGTTTMSPEINWFLVPEINSWSGNRYIGSTTHQALNSFSFYKSTRTLTIPSSTPRGTYYLAANVANSNDAQNQNDSSWLDRPIVVTRPPANDDLSSAFTVFYSGSTTGTNVDATLETGEPAGGSSSSQSTVWWTFIAPDDGTMTIDTFSSNFDTVLDVFTGTSLSNLALVPDGHDDDSDGGRQSEVFISVAAGQRYYVRVGGYFGAQGNVSLNLDFEADLCSFMELVGNELTVNATLGPDNVTVQQFGTLMEVAINDDCTETFAMADVDRVIINGFGGADVIRVTALVPTLINGGFGPDEIFGGPLENDIFGGPGPDLIHGGPMDDVINAGQGQDTVFAFGGNDVIIGGDSNDTLMGGLGDDQIFGGLGLDVLNGQGGNDTLIGNAGADTLDGGANDDILIGHGGPDELFGGPGNDELNGGAGFDILDGGSGIDTAVDQGEVESNIEN